MMSWKPRDWIAVLVISAAFALIALGHNGSVSAVLAAVVAFYYGWQAAPPKD